MLTPKGCFEGGAIGHSSNTIFEDNNFRKNEAMMVIFFFKTRKSLCKF